MSFWESNVWSYLLILAILFASIIIAYFLKNGFKFLKKSLIPISVLGGIIVLIASSIYQLVSGNRLFDSGIFSIVGSGTSAMKGSEFLEAVTYHCLGLGFVSMAFRRSTEKEKKGRAKDVFNTGLTTVSTYLVQGIFGLIITIAFYLILKNQGTNLIPASGIILCLGFGQGTGQALNFGTQYMNDFGFAGGDHFGLAIAALGFLSAAIGGVIYLNYLRRKGKIKAIEQRDEQKVSDFVEKGEIGEADSVDKFSVQIALVVITYIAAYGLMFGLSALVPSMQATIYGFNFLLGTLMAVLVKGLLNFLRKKNIIKKELINNYLMNRIGGVAFDVMIVAGIAVIDIEMIFEYWYVLLILAVVGAFITFLYINFICKKLFKDYQYEQFLAMYGMLTGTASTGVILLREIDPNLETPASSNLVYQNFPAIVFGLPIMFIIPFAGKGLTESLITLGIVFAYLVVLLLILFRNSIFKKKSEDTQLEESPDL